MISQATLKKKLMKEGLLSDKGKPNEKTPTDWFSKYHEFTHYGKESGPTPVAGGDAKSAPSSTGSSTIKKVEEVIPSKKAKEVEKAESSSSSDDSSDDE